MNKMKVIAECTLVILVICLTGCKKVEPKHEPVITIYADASMQICFSKLSSEFNKTQGVCINFVYGQSAELTEKIRKGGKCDLLVLYGPEEKGLKSTSEMYSLMEGLYISDFVNFATDASYNIFSATKPIKNCDYSDAQRFINMLLSSKGKALLTEYGFKPI